MVLFWGIVLFSRVALAGTMADFMIRFFGPMAATALVIVWWSALSRAGRRERLVVIAFLLVIGALTYALVHTSFRKQAFAVFVIPWMLTAWVAGAVLASVLKRHRASVGFIGAGLVICAAIACLLRIDGVTSELSAEMSGRWSPTKDDLFRAAQADATAHSGVERAANAASDETPLEAGPDDWLEFRGPGRDGRLAGVRIEADWEAHPPKLVWRRPVGPGWSSFAVVQNRLFTQEQRDANEAIVAYDAETGREVWTVRDPARFEEFVSGPGPRGTPTFHEGRVYALGASGILHCVDARRGALLWSRNVQELTDAAMPQYGFAGSPLVADGLVTVFAGGSGGKSVAAFHVHTGEPAWTAGEGTLGYASVQREVFDDVPQYLCTSNAGVSAFEPATGKVLWSNAWPTNEQQPRILQPCRLEGNQLLIGTGLNEGVRLLEIRRTEAGWEAVEAWTSKQFKPYFNDIVVHDDCVYGYDGTLLSAFDLKTQKRLWKKRGYDSGQILLLADQGLLLIATEGGEVALVTAEGRGPRELGRFRAFAGKTWNHPVLVRGRLYLRNSDEAVCYEIELEKAATTEAPGG